MVSYPALRFSLAPRRAESVPVLFTGPAAPNQPFIEVIADLADSTQADVFHAMMLRRNLVEALGLDQFINPEYGPQRA